jgi:CHAT domain-containing protein
MGIILNEQKNYESARRQFGRAMRIVERENHVLERCHVLINIAASYLDEQNVDEALAYYQLSYELSAKSSFENVLRESCFGLGQCHEKKREYDAALSFYRKAIEATEEMRDRISAEPFMIGFARNKLEAYQKAIYLLAVKYAAQNSPDLLGEIFDLVERAKARAFLECIYEAQVDLAESESSILKERQQVISKNISRLSWALGAQTLTRERRHALKSELEFEEEEYIRLISDMKVLKQNPKDILRRETCRIPNVQRQVLSRDGVLLEYLLGEPQSYLIRVSPESAKLYILPAKEKIEGSLRGYLKLISDRALDPRAGIEAAERIGRAIIPLEADESVGNAKALIVIPDGILYYLPFEALRVRDKKGSKYLIERKVISYCPSATTLAVLKDSKDPGKWTKDLLAVGGAIYEQKRARDDGRLHQREERGRTIYQEEGVDLSPLPFSKKEVASIAKLFPRNDVDILVGNEANEEALKKLPLRDYRIIHFACHGFLNERYPFRSALVLSASGGPDGDDGFLQMREIYGLTMNAALVVLSACQTGKGLLERSEGPLGLARPFFFAGARAVISSLWPINDEATVNFMREFYKHLIGGYSAGEALRFAKERMLGSRWSHPFYWAGFVLQGDVPAAGKADPANEALLSCGW